MCCYARLYRGIVKKTQTCDNSLKPTITHISCIMYVVVDNPITIKLLPPYQIWSWLTLTQVFEIVLILTCHINPLLFSGFGFSFSFSGFVRPIRAVIGLNKLPTASLTNFTGNRPFLGHPVDHSDGYDYCMKMKLRMDKKQPLGSRCIQVNIQ